MHGAARSAILTRSRGDGSHAQPIDTTHTNTFLIMTSGNLQFLVSLLNTCETGNEMLEVLEDIVNGQVEYFGE